MDEWRAAGVEQPLTLLTLVASVNVAVIGFGLWRAPGTALKVMGLLIGAGTAYGVSTAPERPHGPRSASS